MVRCRACLSDHINFSIGKIAPFISERMMHGQQSELIYECMSCGLLCMNLNPTDEDMARHYRNYFDTEYIEHRIIHEPEFLSKWCFDKARNHDKYIEEFLLPYTGIPQSILDFGGGNGSETPFIGKTHIDILDVAMTPLIDGCSRVDTINRKYDLVVLCHILEHVPNPIALLKRALTASNKYVYIEVPDEANLYGERPRLASVRKNRGYWHEHMQYFDATSLSFLIDTAGGTVRSLAYHTWEGGKFIKVLVKR